MRQLQKRNAAKNQSQGRLSHQIVDEKPASSPLSHRTRVSKEIIRISRMTFSVDDFGVKRTLKGWFVATKDQQKGPYVTLDDLENDSGQIAATLSIDSGKLLKTILQARLTQRAAPADAEHSQPEIIKLNDREISVLDKRFNLIHPAIDFKDEVAYVGVSLPCQTIFPPRKKEEEPRKIMMHLPFLISSTRKRILYDPQTLEKHGFVPTHIPLPLSEEFWLIEDANSFLNGSTGEVDPKELFEAIKEQARLYIDFPDQRWYDYLTLWIMHTYFFILFLKAPYLYIGGTKRVGKTKLLTFIATLGFNGIRSASISTASIFRVVSDRRCTVTIDEEERLGKATEERHSDWRAVILAGNERGASVYRVEGEERKSLRPVRYDLYSPKAFANIGGIEDVLEDRAHSVILLRSLDKRIINNQIDPNDLKWAELRDKLYRLWLMRAPEVASWVGRGGWVGFFEGLGINSRERELALPIILMAKLVEDHGVPSLVEQAAALIAEMAKQREALDKTRNRDLELVDALRRNVTEDRFYSIREIKEWMFENVEKDEIPKWLTNEWIGRSLRRLGFEEHRKAGGVRECRLSTTQVNQLALKLALTEDEATSKEATQPPHPTQPSSRLLIPDATSKIALRKDKEVGGPFRPPSIQLAPPPPPMADGLPESKVGLREEKPQPYAPLKCNICDTRFSSMELLQEHQATAHGIEKENEKQ